MGQIRIKQAETAEELLSYIEKIERLEIGPENYKRFLNADIREFFNDGGKLSPVIDSVLSAHMEHGVLKQFRLELYKQAAILRSRMPNLSPVPAMTEDAAGDISVSLRQWCSSAFAHRVVGNSPLLSANSQTQRPTMNTMHNAHSAIFINYAHFDNEGSDTKNRWLDRLLQMLKPLVSQEELTYWSDQEIKTGDDWHAKIQAQLEVAKAAVLLVSPAFLASDYIRNSELPVLLKNATTRGVKIFPIIVRPCLYQKAKFKFPNPEIGPQELMLSSIQSVNPPSRALTEMTEAEQDRVLLKVANEVHELIASGQPHSQLPSIAIHFAGFYQKLLYEWKLELQSNAIDPETINTLLTRLRSTLINYEADLSNERFAAVQRQLLINTLEVTNVLKDDPFKKLTMIEPNEWISRAVKAVNSLAMLDDLVKRTQWV